MAEEIHVVPAELREAAGDHQHTSDYLRTVPSSHAAIQDSLDSLGPIFSGLAEAGRDLLEQRRQCYEQQADAHAELAHNLNAVADLWTRHEHDAAQQLGNIGENPR